MKMVAALTAAMIVALACSFAFAEIKPCEELKGEIDARLQAKGVVNYMLEIVPADTDTDRKIVGTCEAGKKKIVYSKEKAK